MSRVPWYLKIEPDVISPWADYTLEQKEFLAYYIILGIVSLSLFPLLIKFVLHCFIQKSMIAWCFRHPGSYPAMFSFTNQYQGRVSSEEGVTQNKPQLGHCRNHLQHNANYRRSSCRWGAALPELAVQSLLRAVKARCWGQ